MTDASAIQMLGAWLSPGFPVGAYSYSHGLEWAIQSGAVRDRETLRGWIADTLRFGAGRGDAILLAHAHAADDPAEIAELAEALAPSSERHLETMQQGAAFAATVSAVWGRPVAPAAYPVAVGCAARAHGAPLALTATLYLQAFAANLVSAGVRLVPLGQTDGQRALAALMPLCADVAAEAMAAPLGDIGGCALTADLAAMLHETQATRLYRS